MLTIITTALQVQTYYVVESNDEEDSYIYFKGKTHIPECLFKAPEEAQVQSSLSISSRGSFLHPLGTLKGPETTTPRRHQSNPQKTGVAVQLQGQLEIVVPRLLDH